MCWTYIQDETNYDYTCYLWGTAPVGVQENEHVDAPSKQTLSIKQVDPHDPLINDEAKVHIRNYASVWYEYWDDNETGYW